MSCWVQPGQAMSSTCGLMLSLGSEECLLSIRTWVKNNAKHHLSHTNITLSAQLGRRAYFIAHRATDAGPTAKSPVKGSFVLLNQFLCIHFNRIKKCQEDRLIFSAYSYEPPSPWTQMDLKESARAKSERRFFLPKSTFWPSLITKRNTHDECLWLAKVVDVTGASQVT